MSARSQTDGQSPVTLGHQPKEKLSLEKRTLLCSSNRETMGKKKKNMIRPPKNISQALRPVGLPIYIDTQALEAAAIEAAQSWLCQSPSVRTAKIR